MRTCVPGAVCNVPEVRGAFRRGDEGSDVSESSGAYITTGISLSESCDELLEDSGWYRIGLSDGAVCRNDAVGDFAVTDADHD